MATILRASDGQMERDVAIKVLHRHLADDPEVRTRFKAEARHAASLSHPNIVAVFDQGDADLPYIVMELIDGPSLREVLASHGPLSPEQALAVVQPLCLALSMAHAQGLIHRDIKPENVLVTPDGVPKLADFGIARVMAATSHTATGTLVGSVHYLAPELVGGIEATPASDQYALAVVAWELLTGRKPLPAETPMAIALRHASEDIPPPSRYAPEVSPALDRVIAIATSREPSQRYTSMEHFAAAFVAAIPGGPSGVTTTAADGVVHTLILPPDAHETMALSAQAHAARVAAQQVLEDRREASPPRGQQAQPRAAPPLPPPRRDGGRSGGGTGARVGLIVLAVLLVAGLAAGGSYLYWDTIVAPEADVPRLVGIDRADAEGVLSTVGLDLVVDSEEHRLEEPAGQIIGQRPAEGARLRAGEVVRVVVSLGPRIVPMPTLVDRVYEDVRAVLEENSFAVAEPVLEHSDTVPVGVVISQAPSPDEPVAQGSPVSVVVSLGIEQVTVPAVEGTEQEDAEAALLAAQLIVGEITATYSDDVPEAGVVISQSVGAGEVDKGTTVDLVVSRGPLTIEVPDVRGFAVDEARAAIEALDLTVTETTDRQPTLGPFTFAPANEVQRQVPAPGEPIQRGQSVEILYFTPG